MSHRSNTTYTTYPLPEVLLLHCRKRLQILPNFIPHTPKNVETLLLWTLERGRIIKASMDPGRRVKKYWAALFRVVANGQGVIEEFILELVHAF
jgi:hypothetical protein